MENGIRSLMAQNDEVENCFSNYDLLRHDFDKFSFKQWAYLKRVIKEYANQNMRKRLTF